jgi:hypothetical protein
MNATTAESIQYASGRALKTIKTALSVLGMMFLMVVIVPSLELKISPPVSTWDIVNVQREGRTLTWDVLILKHRDCRANTTWVLKGGGRMARIDNWTAPLIPGLELGVQTIVGPFQTMIPAGMEKLPDLKLDATVSYDCGIRWTLPKVDVKEVPVNGVGSQVFP